MTAIESLSSKTSRRDFWKRLAVLLFTIAGQNLIVYAVNLLDNIMIGRIPEGAELAISAVFIVNQIQFLLQMIVGGISDGTVVICSRFWGEGNLRDIKKAASTAMTMGMLISGILLGAVLLFPDGVLSLFTDKPYVIEEAKKYLFLVSFTYLLFTATQVLLGILRSIECAGIGFLVSCAALVTNLVLNYILIFGHFGAPALGIRGAAIATLVSRAVELLIVVLYTAFVEKKLRIRFADFFRPDREITRKFVKVSIPVVLSGASWGIAMSVQTAILGRLTDPVISANSVASTLFQIVTVLIYASSTASSIMIGKTIGEGTTLGCGWDGLKAEIRHRTGKLQLLYLVLGVLTGATLFCVKDFVIGVYSLSPETAALANQFITVLSVTSIGTAYQMPSLGGIVRGGGDTQFVFRNDLIFMWGIVLPASFLAAFVLKWPPVLIFLCLKADQILKCAVAAVKVNRYRWLKKF